jgi:2-amino-4-hydroxy-6-hydroxymethyldihydropteridine diphosphokinase
VVLDTVVIGLGGNVGTDAEIVERFRRTRDALAHLGELRSAPLYRSAPVGPSQSLYLNTAIRARIADLQPAELLATLHEIERLLGRDRLHEARWGPRTIDLDVLVWSERVIDTPELEVPHPRLVERRFALEPLVALVGEDFVIPGVGATGVLLGRVRDQRVEQIAETW